MFEFLKIFKSKGSCMECKHKIEDHGYWEGEDNQQLFAMTSNSYSGCGYKFCPCKRVSFNAM